MTVASLNRLAATLGAASLCTAGVALAQPDAQTFTDSARVVSSTPIYGAASEPRQQCHTEYRTNEQARTDSSSPIGAITGGVIGGVIGHQFGSGRGNTAATIGGAAAGAAIGSQIDRNSADTYVEPSTQAVERCETVGERQAITGYDVVYTYDGREFHTQLPYDPGRRLDVDVTVAPR